MRQVRCDGKGAAGWGRDVIQGGVSELQVLTYAYLGVVYIVSPNVTMSLL